jgi:hypothetical protein
MEYLLEAVVSVWSMQRLYREEQSIVNLPPLRDLPMKNAEMGSDGNSTKHLEQVRVRAKVGHLPSY